MSVPATATEAEGVRAEPAPDRLALAAFLGAVVIGGSNYVAVRYSNRELDPLWGAGLRFAGAAVVFGALCAGFRLPLPRGRLLGVIALYGLLAFGVAYGCLYWALQEVPAGIGAVVMAVSPLLVLLLAVAHRLERFNWRALIGALIALVGSIVIFFQPSSVSFGWGSLVLLGFAAFAASESVVVSKHVGRQHPLVMNFVGMTAGAAALLVASAAAGENLALPREGKSQIAVIFLVAATVGLFSLVLFVVQRWTASATSYVFVAMPIVAVVLGALIADERITLTTVIGGAIVCAGVYLGALARRGPPMSVD